MSSDVYVTFYQGKKKVERIRVGHLGVMHYFGFDALTATCDLQQTHPVINTEWAAAYEDIALKLQEANAKAQAMSTEDFGRAFGYVGPEGIEWEDAPQPGEATEYLKEYGGLRWDFGWD